MFSPDTDLRLLHVPYESDYADTIWFPDADTQYQYMVEHTKHYLTDFNYQKKDSFVIIPGVPEQYWNVNYAMYRNSNYTNKWFYAFVTSIEWASMNSTKLYITTDVLQTWYFDLNWKQSFIIRQHGETDTPGDNLQPEDISGALVKYQTAGAASGKPSWLAVYATSTSTGVPVTGKIIDGLYSGAGQVFLDEPRYLGSFLNSYVENGTITAVSRIQGLPVFDSGMVGPGTYNANYPKHPNDIEGYVPRNKKLLSGAFIQGFVSGYGQEIKFNPEWCIGDGVTIRFSIAQTTGTVLVCVYDYGLVYDETTTVGGNTALCLTFTIPESTWAYNQYKNDYNLHSGSNSLYRQSRYMTREIEQGRNGMEILASGADAVSAGLETLDILDKDKDFGGAGGAIRSTYNAVAAARRGESYINGYDDVSIEFQKINESYNAPATGGVTQSSPFIAADLAQIKYGWLVMPRDICQRMDNFLDVYGYAQQKYGIPNFHARKAYTYIKLAKPMVYGDVPDSDMLIIKGIMVKGIHYWAHTADFGDFSQDNGVLS